jgi:hypothetical protein
MRSRPATGDARVRPLTWRNDGAKELKVASAVLEDKVRTYLCVVLRDLRG